MQIYEKGKNNFKPANCSGMRFHRNLQWVAICSLTKWTLKCIFTSSCIHKSVIDCEQREAVRYDSTHQKDSELLKYLEGRIPCTCYSNEKKIMQKENLTQFWQSMFPFLCVLCAWVSTNHVLRNTVNAGTAMSNPSLTRILGFRFTSLHMHGKQLTEQSWQHENILS